jgi:tetratricopeptide (TPR) repeat protein
MSRRLASVAIGLAFVAFASSARADATVWSRARSPNAARRAELVAEADSLLERHARSRHELSDSSTDPVLREALRRLDEAGGVKSNDVNVLVRYGNVLDELHDYAGCVRVLEAAIKLPAPPPVRAGAHERLAICHAHLGHQAEEIKNYDAALLLQSDSSARSLLLSNRAESLMAIGDISGAIAGYREAIVLRPFAATTYWGLGVALDRSGNLDGALEAIRIARTYDRADRDINGGGWFFSPLWDEPWYRALGHWQHAREATQPAARTEQYLAAVARWEEYIQRAPTDDRYLPFARVRLKECERERDRVLKRRPQSTTVPKTLAPWEVSPVAPKAPPAPKPAAPPPTLPLPKF